jgi:RNA polymerase-binding protein DksA
MTAKKYEPLRKKLTEERERVEQLVRAESDKRMLMSDTAEHERYGNHPGDEGTETFEKEASLAMQGNLQVILDEVDHALHKLDAGTYGSCDECGKEIPIERLEVRPQATLCIACKSKVEHSQMVAHLEPASPQTSASEL